MVEEDGGRAPLAIEVRGPAAWLALDRPTSRNALDEGLLRGLVDAAARLDAMQEVRVVVLTGRGDSFCAGADRSLFEALDALTPEAGRELATLGSRMAAAVEGMRAITIAALHGWCVGGGVVLAAACDLRLAADDTRFALPEVDLGIPLTWGGIPRLVRELGPTRTRELVLTCRPFDAAEAHAWGFLTRVVPADELHDAAGALASSLAAKPWVATSATVRHVDEVAAHLAGPDTTWADPDRLLAALTDPEARAAREALLHRS